MAVVKDSGIPYQVILYGTKAGRPSYSGLVELVSMLDGPIEDLVRKDATFKSLSLRAADYVGNAAAVVKILDAHIELLQRPVLVREGVAIIGRPKERVAEFLL